MSSFLGGISFKTSFFTPTRTGRKYQINLATQNRLRDPLSSTVHWQCPLKKHYILVELVFVLRSKWGANILCNRPTCSSWLISWNSCWNSSRLPNCMSNRNCKSRRRFRQHSMIFQVERTNAGSSKWNRTNLACIEKMHQHEELVEVVLQQSTCTH